MVIIAPPVIATSLSRWVERMRMSIVSHQPDDDCTFARFVNLSVLTLKTFLTIELNWYGNANSGKRFRWQCFLPIFAELPKPSENSFLLSISIEIMIYLEFWFLDEGEKILNQCVGFWSHTGIASSHELDYGWGALTTSERSLLLPSVTDFDCACMKNG